MIRLLLRIYLLLLVILGFGLALPVITTFLNRDYNKEALEETFRGPMLLIKTVLQQAADENTEIATVQLAFDYPLELVVFGEQGLPRWLKDLDSPDLFFIDFDDETRGLRAFLRYDEERMIRLGPVPPLRYYGRIGAILAVGLLLVAGLLLLRLVLGPLWRQNRALEQASHAISEGNFGVRLRARSVPHSPKLVHAFNVMTARIRQLLLSQRELLQDVSHELRTPLARLRFGLEMLAEEVPSPAERERISAMLDQAIQQLDHLVDELLEYTRLADQDRHAGRFEAVQPANVIRTSLEHLGPQLENGKRVDCQLDRDELPPIRGNTNELVRALDNLVANAMRFARKQVIVRGTDDAGWVEISVEDDGPGVPVDKRDRILQPFVQLERDHAHSGLGLAIVRRIVAGHGGEVVVDDGIELGGAWVRLRFPLLDGGDADLAPGAAG